MQETQVQSLGGGDFLEKEMAPHSSILAQKIPWTEEPGTLQSMGLQKNRLNTTTQNTVFSLGNAGGPEADWQQGPMGPLTTGGSRRTRLWVKGVRGPARPQ